MGRNPYHRGVAKTARSHPPFSMAPHPHAKTLARELDLAPDQVARTLALFDDGNTLPFVARYRKEATGGLDEVQLQAIQDRAKHLREMEERRETILASIKEQGQLTPELEAKVQAAESRQALEDLYLPYRPKRKTRARMAMERGLEPLAREIWEGALDDAGAHRRAGDFVDPDAEVPDADTAVRGARDIVAEWVSEDAELRAWIRSLTWKKGEVQSKAARGKKDEPSKFQDYYAFSEPVRRVASHRILAIRRGEAEGFLRWTIQAPEDEILPALERSFLKGRPARETMSAALEDAWRRLLAPSIAGEIRTELANQAEEEAIAIFGQNLEELLLASPAGGVTVLGLDPGHRTGAKAAVVAPTGAVQATDTLYLHQPDAFARGIRALVERHAPRFVAVGDGTASRETEKAVREALNGQPDSDSKGAATPDVVRVSEAGASVYSASPQARAELPDLDVTLRGAVSIARRLQDPLAELVKIDAKAIGVGQYQHDVNQTRLRERLDQVVEVCVNRVGVELNTASAALLAHVAGIGPTLADRIVEVRDERGGFRSRRQLMEVPRLGAKAFQQAAGFLRIRDGEHPLDRTAVHPERYDVVETMARDQGVPLKALLENEEALEGLDLDRYVTEDVGRPTLEDILEELRRPGRDPRDTFQAPAFRDDVRSPEDLREGMRLEGVVTNVVAFGAFVDVGIGQDGLVHVSQLRDRYVEDPRDVVSVGQRVKVTVLSVDLERGRIGLSMKAA